MKNYELIEELLRLPAGAEVSFEGYCCDVERKGPCDGEEVYLVRQDISGARREGCEVVLS